MASSQVCLIQDPNGPSQLSLSHAIPAPFIQHPHEVLVRVSAVALNPIDWKVPHYFPTPGSVVGCDFSGIIIARGDEVTDFAVGQRVCGAIISSPTPERQSTGAFARFLVADARALIAVPPNWSDLQAAALGGVGWYTAGLTLYDQDMLQLTGRPSHPAPLRADGTRVPVLVYGGATATGTMMCQWLSRSGYAVIATTSVASSAMVKTYGAIETIDYASPDCVAQIRRATGGQLRHVIDCVTTKTTMSICMEAICRVGGRYICLEDFQTDWISRKAVRVSLVVGAEALGQGLTLQGPYARDPDPCKLEITMQMRCEMQKLIDTAQIHPHPVRELVGGWDAIRQGLQMLREGSVRGVKLAVKIPQVELESS
ncbi:Deshydrogenase mokE [Penicillium rolfsii]|nr:Deshydrogenase mokE [Penicillium rolfsii]